MASRRLKELSRKPKEFVRQASHQFTDFSQPSSRREPDLVATIPVECQGLVIDKDVGIEHISALCRRMLEIKDQTNFFVMAAYLKQNPQKKAVMHQLMSYGISTEVAVYALLSTGSRSHEAALAFIFEQDDNNGQMQHAFIMSASFNPE